MWHFLRPQTVRENKVTTANFSPITNGPHLPQFAINYTNLYWCCANLDLPNRFMLDPYSPRMCSSTQGLVWRQSPEQTWKDSGHMDTWTHGHGHMDKFLKVQFQGTKYI